MATLHESKVDGFSFTETNLVIRTQEQVQSSAQKMGRNWFKQLRLQTSSSNDPTSQTYYQLGRTCSSAHQGSSDPSGLDRWFYVKKLEGKEPSLEQTNTKKLSTKPSAYCMAQPDRVATWAKKHYLCNKNNCSIYKATPNLRRGNNAGQNKTYL
eukprot:scaffold10016_cov54-Attheya_sp.AAC.9